MGMLDILAYVLSIACSIALWLFALWEICKEHGARGQASVVPSEALVNWAARRRQRAIAESRRQAT